MDFVLRHRFQDDLASGLSHAKVKEKHRDRLRLTMKRAVTLGAVSDRTSKGPQQEAKHEGHEEREAQRRIQRAKNQKKNRGKREAKAKLVGKMCIWYAEVLEQDEGRAYHEHRAMKDEMRKHGTNPDGEGKIYLAGYTKDKILNLVFGKGVSLDEQGLLTRKVLSARISHLLGPLTGLEEPLRGYRLSDCFNRCADGGQPCVKVQFHGSESKARVASECSPIPTSDDQVHGRGEAYQVSECFEDVMKSSTGAQQEAAHKWFDTQFRASRRGEGSEYYKLGKLLFSCFVPDARERLKKEVKSDDDDDDDDEEEDDEGDDEDGSSKKAYPWKRSDYSGWKRGPGEGHDNQRGSWSGAPPPSRRRRWSTGAACRGCSPSMGLMMAVAVAPTVASAMPLALTTQAAAVTVFGTASFAGTALWYVFCASCSLKALNTVSDVGDMVVLGVEEVVVDAVEGSKRLTKSILTALAIMVVIAAFKAYRRVFDLLIAKGPQREAEEPPSRPAAEETWMTQRARVGRLLGGAKKGSAPVLGISVRELMERSNSSYGAPSERLTTTGQINLDRWQLGTTASFVYHRGTRADYRREARLIDVTFQGCDPSDPILHCEELDKEGHVVARKYYKSLSSGAKYEGEEWPEPCRVDAKRGSSQAVEVWKQPTGKPTKSAEALWKESGGGLQAIADAAGEDPDLFCASSVYPGGPASGSTAPFRLHRSCTSNRKCTIVELPEAKTGSGYGTDVAYLLAEPKQAIVPIVGGNNGPERFQLTQMRCTYVSPNGSVPMAFSWQPTSFHTGRDTKKVTIEELKKMEFSFHSFQYTADQDDMFMVLCRKAALNLTCQLIMDKGNFMRSPCVRQNARLIAFYEAGGEIRLMSPIGGMYAVMHAKTIIVDGQVLLTGSVNMTNNGHGSSKEHLVRIEEPGPVQEAMGDFEKCWDDAEEEKVTASDIEMLKLKDQEADEEKERKQLEKVKERQEFRREKSLARASEQEAKKLAKAAARSASRAGSSTDLSPMK